MNQHEGHEIVVEVKTWTSYPVTGDNSKDDDELLVLDVNWNEGDNTESDEWEDRIICLTCERRLYADDFAEHKTRWETQ